MAPEEPVAPEEPSAAPPVPRGASLVSEVEGRLVEMVVLIRLGTCSFLFLPIAKWGRLERPWIAVLVAVAGGAEATWFAATSRRRRGGVTAAVVLADVAFCVLLMAVGSRAVRAQDRNLMMTELIPFSLGSSAVVGVSTLSIEVAAAAVVAMMLAWVASLAPVLPAKTLSDLLGFALWLVIGRVISSGWRRLAGTADRAREEADRAWAQLAAQERLAAEQERRAAEAQRRQQLARHREALHREVHDFLLPVVEHVAAARTVTTDVVAWADRTARRARLRLENELTDSPSGLLDQLADAVTAAEARGLRVRTSLAARCSPPRPVAEVVIAAVTEALTNIAKHAGTSTAVLAVLDHEDGGLQITVRDRGAGFDPDRVALGGGLARTFAAVRSHGGRVEVDSAPGRGTRVTIRWRPAAVPGHDREGLHDGSGPAGRDGNGESTSRTDDGRSTTDGADDGRADDGRAG